MYALLCAGIDCRVVETTRMHHANEMVSALSLQELQKIDGIVAVRHIIIALHALVTCLRCPHPCISLLPNHWLLHQMSHTKGLAPASKHVCPTITGRMSKFM